MTTTCVDECAVDQGKRADDDSSTREHVGPSSQLPSSPIFQSSTTTLSSQSSSASHSALSQSSKDSIATKASADNRCVDYLLLGEG